MFSFGAKPAAPGTAFGAPAATAATSQPQPPAFGFGGAGTTGFGSVAPGTAAPGAAAVAAPSAFSFGGASAAAKPATATGTGLFGSAATAPPAGGGLFGAATSTAPTGGLFGATATQQPAAGGGGGLFGTNTATSTPFGFGNATAAAKPAAPFGSATTGGFGTLSTNTAWGAQPSQPSLMGQQSMQLTQQQQQQQLAQQPKPPVQQIKETMEHIFMAWNPESPQCQFRHYFYNMVHPSEVARYQIPPKTDVALYEQAMRDNPDPTCLVPVLAVGFGDLQKRIEFQKQQSEIHQGALSTISQELDETKQKHELHTLVRLEERRRRAMELSHRMLRLMKNVHLLRTRGYSITTEDEKFRARLDNMHMHLHRPSQFRGRVNELWAQVQMLRDAGRLGALGRGKGGGRGQGVYEVVDHEQLAKINKIYDEMQKGESFLIESINRDNEDLEIMRKGLQEKLMPFSAHNSPGDVGASSFGLVANNNNPSTLASGRFSVLSNGSSSRLVPT